MSTFVLVHGAWHGAWCWFKVSPLLEAAGHRVEAPDLPGLGVDKTPTSEVSLQGYTDRVCQVIDRQSGPVVLVGHSMGGMAISQAAEQRPKKVQTLVYLSAFLLRDGVSQLQISGTDPDSLVRRQRMVDEDEGVVTLPSSAYRQIFYEDCSDEDVTLARSLLVPQALAPIRTPIAVTEENFGRVPRTYIACTRDRAVAPSIQKRMYTESPCREVVSMDTGHSPFLSAPEALAEYLLFLGVGRRGLVERKGL